MYKHVIPSRVRMKQVKEGSNHGPCNEAAKVRKRAIKFHLYYFMLGFTFHMPHLFQEVIFSMKWTSAQCSPNVVCVMVGFSNLRRFLDLGVTINEFSYFFNISHKEWVWQLMTRHRLFDSSSKVFHEWFKNNLEVGENGKWTASFFVFFGIIVELFLTLSYWTSIFLCAESKFGYSPKIVHDMKKIYVTLGISAKCCEWCWLLTITVAE